MRDIRQHILDEKSGKRGERRGERVSDSEKGERERERKNILVSLGQCGKFEVKNYCPMENYGVQNPAPISSQEAIIGNSFQ